MGIFFVTLPQNDLKKYKTTIYFRQNNGSDLPADLGLKSITPYNSCTKLLNQIKYVRIVMKKTLTSIYMTDNVASNSECVLVKYYFLTFE